MKVWATLSVYPIASMSALYENLCRKGVEESDESGVENTIGFLLVELKAPVASMSSLYESLWVARPRV